MFLPGAFDLALSETSTFGEAAVRVGRVVEGAFLCVHEGEMRADIDVVAGSCRPLVGGVEILDRLPIHLSEEDVEVRLSGVGPCEVRATTAGGSTASLVIDVDNPPPVPEPCQGTPLSSSPIELGGEVEQHGACKVTKNLTNGNCEIVDAAGVILPDADCLFDVKWRKDHYDPDDPDDPGDPQELGSALVGVDLSTELHLRIEYELIGFIPFGSYAPNALTIVSMPLGVSIDSHGCNDDGWEVMVLTPEAEGDYTLEISASNAFEPTTFPLQARTVERFLADFGAEDVERTAEGTRAWFFVGSDVQPTIRYEDGSGNRLRGAGALLVASDDGRPERPSMPAESRPAWRPTRSPWARWWRRRSTASRWWMPAPSPPSPASTIGSSRWEPSSVFESTLSAPRASASTERAPCVRGFDSRATTRSSSSFRATPSPTTKSACAARTPARSGSSSTGARPRSRRYGRCGELRRPARAIVGPNRYWQGHFDDPCHARPW